MRYWSLDVVSSGLLVDDRVGLAAVRVGVAQREAGVGVVAEAELREDLRREAGGSQGVTHLQRVVADRVVRGQHRDDLVDGAHRSPRSRSSSCSRSSTRRSSSSMRAAVARTAREVATPSWRNWPPRWPTYQPTVLAMATFTDRKRTSMNSSH